MYWVVIERPTNINPYTTKSQRTIGSAVTPRTAPKARRIRLPVGTTSGLTSRDQRASIKATPTESSAAKPNTAELPRWRWSIMNAPRAGPAPKPKGLLAAKSPIARPKR